MDTKEQRSSAYKVQRHAPTRLNRTRASGPKHSACEVHSSIFVRWRVGVDVDVDVDVDVNVNVPPDVKYEHSVCKHDWCDQMVCRAP